MEQTEKFGQNKVSLEEALERIRQAVKPLETVWCSLDEAHGAVLAEAVTAAQDQPPFPRSPLDGYALKGEETAGATRERPAVFSVVGKICAGDRADEKIEAGEVVRIMTGAQIPEGANAVVRQENTDLGGTVVSIWKGVKPYENYCFQGEDYRAGDVLLKEGTKLDYIALGILASCGKAQVKVRRKPRISLITTGNELIAPGETLTKGKIYNTNLYLIQARLQEWGVACRAVSMEDEAEPVEKTILSELEWADGVITTGGVSVGEKDIFNEVLPAISDRILWEGLAMKPGSPSKCAMVHGKPVLALSGNPFAAAAVLELAGRVMIGALLGSEWLECQRVHGRLVNLFPKRSSQRRLIRGRLEQGDVWIPDTHGSGQIRSFLWCNCMVDIPGGTGELGAGAEVAVWLL